MDIHPIVVHFPIAFLTLYCIFEIARSQRLMQKPFWFNVKAILVIFGTLGALASWFTGPRATHYAEGVRLIEMHGLFGTLTLILFILISIIYIMELYKPNKLSLRLMNPWIIIPLALIGLVLITITGALGGAIVYGTDFDPLMKPILQLLKVF